MTREQIRKTLASCLKTGTWSMADNAHFLLHVLDSLDALEARRPYVDEGVCEECGEPRPPYLTDAEGRELCIACWRMRAEEAEACVAEAYVLLGDIRPLEVSWVARRRQWMDAVALRPVRDKP